MRLQAAPLGGRVRAVAHNLGIVPRIDCNANRPRRVLELRTPEDDVGGPEGGPRPVDLQIATKPVNVTVGALRPNKDINAAVGNVSKPR